MTSIATRDEAEKWDMRLRLKWAKMDEASALSRVERLNGVWLFEVDHELSLFMIDGFLDASEILFVQVLINFLLWSKDDECLHFDSDIATIREDYGYDKRRFA